MLSLVFRKLPISKFFSKIKILNLYWPKKAKFSLFPENIEFLLRFSKIVYTFKKIYIFKFKKKKKIFNFLGKQNFEFIFSNIVYSIFLKSKILKLNCPEMENAAYFFKIKI